MNELFLDTWYEPSLKTMGSSGTGCKFDVTEEAKLL